MTFMDKLFRREPASPTGTDPLDELLDRAVADWKVDGASPYMDTRVFARIAEIRNTERRRAPMFAALATGMAALTAVGVYVGFVGVGGKPQVAMLDEDPAMLSDMDMLEDAELLDAMAAVAEGDRG